MRTEIKLNFKLVATKRPQNTVAQGIDRFISLKHKESKVDVQVYGLLHFMKTYRSGTRFLSSCNFFCYHI